MGIRDFVRLGWYLIASVPISADKDSSITKYLLYQNATVNIKSWNVLGWFGRENKQLLVILQ